MRDEAPVYRNERFDFYALSRFDDVEAAHRDPRRFSSAHGTVLELMGPSRMAAGQMIFVDPPDHTQLRALVSRAFTPRRVHAARGRDPGICARAARPACRQRAFDYVQDFARCLPSMVISALLGVPDTDREQVRQLIDTMFHIEPGVGMINDISFAARI